MPEIKIAVQAKSMRMPLDRLLPIVKRWNAHAVELDARGDINPQSLSQTGIRQLRKTFDDYEVRVAAVGFRTRRGYDSDEDLDRRMEATKAALKFAYDLGAAWVINQVGHVPEEPQGPRWNLLLEALTDLGRFGQRTGALIAAETGSESGADLARLIQALPPGSLGVAFNPGKLIINGFSPQEALTALGPDVSYVYAQDGVRDLAQGRGIEVQLGRGSADLPALFGALEEHGYRGYWTVLREQSTNPVPEMADAVSYLRNL